MIPLDEKDIAIFSKRFLEIFEKFGEIEIENVEIAAEELTLVLQPAARALLQPRAIPPVAPPKMVDKLIAGEYMPPIESYAGTVAEVQLGAKKSDGGSRGKIIKVGGHRTLPFYSFEAVNPNRPVFAMDVFDMAIPLAKAVRQHFEGVMEDPAEWAKRCIEEFHADLVSLNLVSTDPLLKDTSPKEAAKTVERVLQAVDVPLVIGGSGNKQKDPFVLEAAAEVAHGERCVLNPATLDSDYQHVVEAAKEHLHSVVAFTSMDLNNQKKLNRLLLDEGLPKSQIVMDPTTGALGYGIEYSVSLMERIKLGGLLGDTDLQMPILAPASNAWGARESWIKSDSWGPKELRGPIWETITALTIMLSGGDLFMMSHPVSIRVLKQLADQLFGKVESKQEVGDWVSGLR